MWWAVTQALYTGGAGSAIIGGLYWTKGTTAGAWTALLVGSGLATGGILARQYDPHFPLNGVQISFGATVIAVVLYVAVSWLTCRDDYNLDRLLHRGAFATILDAVGDTPEPLSATARRPSLWHRLIGIDEHFSRSDRWLSMGLVWWSLGWFAVALAGTVWNILSPWPLAVWARFWQVAGIGIPMLLTFVTAIWFTWGGGARHPPALCPVTTRKDQPCR